MKRMKKKQLEKYIEDMFGDVNNDGSWRGSYIGMLCRQMPVESRWNEHWEKINKSDFLTMRGYVDWEASDEEISFLRLLTLHLFVRGE